MTAYLLHWREPNGKRAPLLNKYVQMFGMRGVTIDPSGKSGKREGSLHFPSINVALASPVLRDLQWVWLDHRAEICIDEYEHPESGVVYCVGSDQNGFGIKPPKGIKVKIRDWAETFAACIVPMVAYDRHLFLNGRRK